MSTASVGFENRFAARPSTPRLRLTKRGRAVLMTLAATPLVVAALVLGLNGGGAVASFDAPGSFEYVTVESGQTLWQLAEAIAPTADPRDVIAAVMLLNQLDSPDVLAGQQLAIPAQYAR